MKFFYSLYRGVPSFRKVLVLFSSTVHTLFGIKEKKEPHKKDVLKTAFGNLWTGLEKELKIKV